MNNIAIPKRVEAQMIEFCNSLRAIDFLGNDSSVLIYRNIIRDNTHEILDKTFPLFSKELGGKTKNKIVDGFLLQHNASEAEFHKIATELVCFIQNNDFVDATLRCLLEYEWILYHLEISDKPGELYITKQYLPNLASNMQLKLNPTLKFIKLPFLIQDGIPLMDQGGDFIYALFKNSKNEILRKRVLSFDLSILNFIVDQKISLIADLEKLILDENKEYWHKWIIQNIAEEFVSLN